MKHNDPLKKYMSKNLVTIDKMTKLSEARKLFLENNIHHLPVTQGEGELVGMLSYSDLLRVDSGELFNQDAKQADVLIDNMSCVEAAMTKNVIKISVDESIRDATIALKNGSFHSLPVVDGKKIVGIVTSTDLLNYFLEQY